MKSKVNITTWSRKLAYNTFSKYTNPYTGMVTKIDVSNLIDICKFNDFSFYGCMTYCALASMKDINAFSYGYGKENGKQFVYMFDSLATSVTVINKENELNFTRYIEYNQDIVSLWKSLIMP